MAWNQVSLSLHLLNSEFFKEKYDLFRPTKQQGFLHVRALSQAEMNREETWDL